MLTAENTSLDASSIVSKARRRFARDWKSLKQSARKSAARTIYSLPPFLKHDPRRRVTTSEQLCRRVENFPAPGSTNWRLPIRPPEIVSRTNPISFDADQAEKFRTSAARYQNGVSTELPEVFLACFQNAKIYSQDFLVLSRDNRILFESALLQQNVLEKNGILETLVWPSARAHHPIGCLLAQETPYAYYHWLIEVLPKLSILRRFESLASVPLIVPPALKPFQRDSLKQVGISDTQLLPFDNGCWELGNLFFPSLLGPTGSPAPAAVAWLRQEFLKSKPSAASSPKRIYLTRRDAAQRRVLNETEVVAFLEAAGFSVICPGELSLAEQIDLFRNVEIVVAAHGAGATNMVFAPPGATLIELFGDNYINGCFWALANVLGQKYGFVTGPATWLDYEISIPHLRRVMDTILSN